MNRRRSSMRTSHLKVLFPAAVLWCAGAWAQQKTFDVPATEAVKAIPEFARQAGIQIVAPADDLRQVRTAALRGALDTRVALKQLLVGTGLEVASDDGSVITLKKSASPVSSTATSSTDAAERTGSLMHVAQSQPGADKETGRSTDKPAADSAATAPEPQEIVVTAQKRAERLQEVPVPVTAINATDLVDSNRLRLQEYFATVPGLSLTPGVRGDPVLAIRGVTTGGGNPTVGVTIDDVPYGSSTTLGGGSPAPDIDPSELARIEVLRGPQGTFYGASSIGGLLKYVTMDPSTDGFSGRVQAGLSSTRGGDDLGHSVRAAINVPLTETFAVRLSGFARRDPGFIDDPVLGIKNVNQVDVEGGRLSALWRASDAFSVRLSALVQRVEGEGSPSVHLVPGLGDLEQAALPGSGQFERKIQAYSLTATGRLGAVELTSLSGYTFNRIADSTDYTPVFGPFTELIFGVPGTALEQRNQTKKFTQELRLSGSMGRRTDWLIGAFYTDEDSPYKQEILAIDGATGATAGSWVYASFPTTFSEYAAFADLTFHLTERFDVQVGGRQSRNRQTYTELDDGPFVDLLLGVPSPLINPRVATRDSSFTYLLTPRLRVNGDLMVYARLTSGYRVGGPNPTSTVFGLPPHFDPDKTNNYEVGAKGNLLGSGLAFDVSVYSIDWEDIQLSLIDASGAGYYANASRARSQGAEVSLESRPLPGLTVAAWAAWSDATLTEGFPAGSAAFGVSGNRLPYSSRLSGNLSVEQEFPMFATARGFVGASLSYVGDRVGAFTGSSARQQYPSFSTADMHAGVRYDSWTVNLFFNNIGDKRGLLSGGLGTPVPVNFNYIQPRTLGLSLSKMF